MFKDCKSLISLPNLSKWNTDNLNNMKEMFYGCSNLVSLPDLSNWNINNVEVINSLCENCSSLTSLPDISKWNMNNITDISNLFRGCFSLISLPDLKKWKRLKDIIFGNSLEGCISLLNGGYIINFPSEYKFKWKGNAKNVFITGDFYDWNIKEKMDKNGVSGYFEKTVILSRIQEKYFFKFIVDGYWMFSKEYPTCRDIYGNTNNYIEIYFD